MLKHLFVLCGVLALAGCQTAVKTPKFEPIGFSHRPVIKLDVARIDIDETYVSPLRAPNIEHKFPVPPAVMVRNWVRDRLRAVGSSGTALLLIEDASVREEKLKIETGVKGLTKIEQSERYTGRIKVRLIIERPQVLQKGFAEALVSYQRTVPENISLNQRDKVFYEMTLQLGQELDRALEASIRKHLGMALR